MDGTQNEEKEDKFSYLQAKYIFRYPFTFKAIKWGGAIGIFLGLHSFIKNRSAQKAFESLVWGSVLSTFPVWGFFMAKYNFYEESIENYEREESAKILAMENIKKYVEFKLNLQPGHDLTEEQLMKEYQSYLEQLMRRNSELDCLLKNVNATTFNI